MEQQPTLRPNTLAALDAALERFDNWLRIAAPGDTYIYHVGLLSADRWEAIYNSPAGDLTYRPVEPFHTVGLNALAAAEAGLVTLWQRRLGPAEYEYLARRTKQHA